MSCFIKTITIVLLLFTSIDAGYGEVLFRTGIEEHDSEVRINWRFGNCSWRGRRPIAPEIVEVTVAMAENAGPTFRSSIAPEIDEENAVARVENTGRNVRYSSSILSHGNSNFNKICRNCPSASPGAIPKSPVNSNL